MPVTGAIPTVRVVGRYALYQPIASGGSATVFLGRLLGPVGFSRTVAVKRLHPEHVGNREFVASFLDEARLVARVRHPNVVPTVDVVASGGEVFLVMEYVHGESLSKLVRFANEQGRPIPVSIVVAIMSGALQGLEAAHTAKSERGAPLQIVHRDVSPQNILVGADGQARILDFGIARAIDRLQTTQVGQVKGKVAYMSPEQLHGQPLGPPTDVYAAAVVTWEALTGRRLFRGASDGRLVVAIQEAPLQRPSDAVREVGDELRARAVAPLDDIIMRALSRNQADRWQSAREFARALESAVSPASTAQVSDWMGPVAATVLAERAALVAEIESGSAVDVTQGDIGVALGDGALSKARADDFADNLPTIVRAPDLGADGVLPSAMAREVTSDAAVTPMSRHPDTVQAYGAPIHDHPHPVSTDPDPRPGDALGAPADWDDRIATLKSARPTGPNPAPGMAPVAPALLRTLQSAPSPIAHLGPSFQQPLAPPPIAAPPPVANAPQPGQKTGSVALIVVGVAVVALVAAGAFAVYSHMASAGAGQALPRHLTVQ